MAKMQKTKMEKGGTACCEEATGNYISISKVPGKKDCLDCIKTEPEVLGSRTWSDIKIYVHNIKEKKDKKD